MHGRLRRRLLKIAAGDLLTIPSLPDDNYNNGKQTPDFAVTGGQDYYLVVKEGDVDVVSAISEVSVPSRQAVSTRYYNVAGQSSATPMDGMNIVVTRYDDGTQAVTKVLK